MEENSKTTIHSQTLHSQQYVTVLVSPRRAGHRGVTRALIKVPFLGVGLGNPSALCRVRFASATPIGLGKTAVN